MKGFEIFLFVERDLKQHRSFVSLLGWYRVHQAPEVVVEISRDQIHFPLQHLQSITVSQTCQELTND